MVMLQRQRKISDIGLIIAGLVFMNAIILNAALTENQEYYWLLLVSVPLLVIVTWACAVN
jgi:hypothetical protein